jgi:hypothetical protein
MHVLDPFIGNLDYCGRETSLTIPVFSNQEFPG